MKNLGSPATALCSIDLCEPCVWNGFAFATYQMCDATIKFVICGCENREEEEELTCERGNFFDLFLDRPSCKFTKLSSVKRRFKMRFERTTWVTFMLIISEVRKRKGNPAHHTCALCSAYCAGYEERQQYYYRPISTFLPTFSMTFLAFVEINYLE